MAVTSWLIDKSAYARLQLGQTADIDAWSARIGRGLVRLSTITRLNSAIQLAPAMAAAASSRAPRFP